MRRRILRCDAIRRWFIDGAIPRSLDANELAQACSNPTPTKAPSERLIFRETPEQLGPADHCRLRRRGPGITINGLPKRHPLDTDYQLRGRRPGSSSLPRFCGFRPRHPQQAQIRNRERGFRRAWPIHCLSERRLAHSPGAAWRLFAAPERDGRTARWNYLAVERVQFPATAIIFANFATVYPGLL